MKAQRHYELLLRPVVERYGELEEGTLTSIIGFSAGGPVSLCKVQGRDIYVTGELSLYPEQRLSAEGLRFELLSSGDFEEHICRKLFTALGSLSMEAALGHEHTVDAAAALELEQPCIVSLKLFSRTTI